MDWNAGHTCSNTPQDTNPGTAISSGKQAGVEARKRCLGANATAVEVTARGEEEEEEEEERV